MAKPKFTVIQGGTGDSISGTFTPTGIKAPDGSEYFKTAGTRVSSGGGSNGGDHAVNLATLSTRVTGAFVWLGILTAGLGAAFLFFLLRIDDRFDRVDQPLRELSSSVAMQTEALKGVDEKLGAMRLQFDTPPVNTQGGSKVPQPAPSRRSSSTN